MNRLNAFIISFLFLILAPGVAESQKVQYIKVPELEKILANPDDMLFVINFWATWCAPCVKELPYFEKVAKEYDPSEVQFLLISLDFPSQAEKQLPPFLKKNKITLPVLAMMETDANLWIDKVDRNWQGDIPATLFINNALKKRKFSSGMLEADELRTIINQLK